jgi:hypothetical protein
MSGNMLSRWTDFFISDGEKTNRKRDDKFINDLKSRGVPSLAGKTMGDIFGKF